MIHFFLLFLDSVKRASEIMNPFPTFKKTLLCIRGKYLTTNHNSIFLIVTESWQKSFKTIIFASLCGDDMKAGIG